MTDEKSGQNLLRSIFNPAHHFCRLCLDLLAVRTAFVRKRCGGKFGQSVLVDSSPNSSLVTLGTLVPSQLTCCVGTNLKLQSENHGVDETRRLLQHAGEESSPSPLNVLLHCASPAMRWTRPRRARSSQRQLIMLPHLHSMMSSMDLV